MKERKCRWKRLLVLILTVALIGSSVDYSALAVLAEEGSASVESGDEASPQEEAVGSEKATSNEEVQETEKQEELEDGAPPTLEKLEQTETEDLATDNPKSEDEEASVKEENTDPANTEIPKEDELETDIQENNISNPSESQKKESISEEAASAEPKAEESVSDKAVEEVKALLAALPTLDDIKLQSSEGQAESYNQIQDTYDAYDVLTDEQKAQIEGAEDIFAPLFEYFNGLVQPLRESKQEEVTVDVEFTITTPENDLPDNGELFDSYLEKLLYEDIYPEIVPFGNFGDDRLSGANKTIYNTLKTEIERVAKGEISSTKFVIADMPELSWAYSELGLTTSSSQDDIKTAVKQKFGETCNTKSIMSYLLMDCPYELYWFDKTKGINSSYNISLNGSSVTLKNLTISFVVANEYKGADDNTVDNTKLTVVNTAIQNAKAIVAANAGKSDYEKLVAYRQEICRLVSYNDSAADAATKPAYGNPWQLIWVFDGDASTKVVCEGYSKAFQYLCDLSNFTGDTTCYTVSGIMAGGTGAGPHMWNIVTLDGKNYLVDVTNCDTGTVGADDKLFLVGTSGSAETGYSFRLSTSITYTYDADELDLYKGTNILTLAGSNYQPKQTPNVNIPQITVTYGDPVNDSVLSAGSATVNASPVSGTFSWAKDVTSYGNSGTKTLKAVFNPDDPNAYSSVTNINVTVIVNRKKVNNPIIEVSPSTYEYTGNAIIPTKVTVKDGNKEIPTSEYTLEYSNNVNYGTATVTVKDTGNGNYELSGTLTASFEIHGLGTVSNKVNGGYTTQYTYNAAAIAAPTKAQFDTNGGTAFTFQWYRNSVAEGNKLPGEPKDAGSYILQVRVAATGNISEAVLNLPVTISKAKLTISPKAQTITYGGMISSDTSQINVTGLQGSDQLESIQLTTNNKDVTTSGIIRAQNAVIKNANTTVNNNYEITYGTGTLIINKVATSIILENTYSVTKVYDGVRLQVPTTVQLTVSGASYNDVTFAWYKDSNGAKGDKLSSAPVDAGIYWLEAFVTETANMSAARVEKKVSITKRPITITAAPTEKTYASVDPKLTYTIDDATPIVAGESLNGTLIREAGEDVKTGGYAILQGTLTNENNPNYSITFTSNTFTIRPADYSVSVEASQNILEGSGTFREPSFIGVKGEKVNGSVVYTYGSNANKTYEELKAILAALPLDTTGSIAYSFTPSTNNYTGTKQSSIQFTIRDIEFLVGNDTAINANAVTIKSNPTYGDDWSEIIKIGAITAKSGSETDGNKAHFTLDMSGLPDAGDGQIFTVLYNGELNGKTYTNVEVCSGTVDVAKKTLQVSAGSYKVSKTYDGTTSVGTASGSLNLTGMIASDTGISVSTAPIEYQNPNVGGQEHMTVSLTLVGDTKGNYVLNSTSIEVPCEILPKPITPVVEVTGDYHYTGSAIIPTFAVKDGTTELTMTDYIAEFQNHINAGEAKITISAKAGGNYTWNPAIETTFTIEKVDYTGTKTGNTSANYGNAASFDLASMLPAGYQLGTIRVSDEEQIFGTAPTLEGTKIQFTLSNDKTKVGKMAKVTIPVTESTNYHAFELTITIQMSEKFIQSDFQFASADQSKYYGEEDFVNAVTGAAAGSTVVYTSSDPSVATVDQTGKVHILKVGNTIITATASETSDYVSTSVSYKLTVAPKVLTWDVSELTAVDKAGTITDSKASLYGELKVSGILSTDSTDVTFTCTADRLIGIYSAVTAGEQTVTLSWANAAHPAILQGTKAENYILPDTLPELTGNIHTVSDSLPTPPESTAHIGYKLEVESGISEVPEAFKNMEHLNTPAKIETQMKLKIQEKVSDLPDENMKVYDVVLMVNVDGTGWTKATAENFPQNGLTITMPYPEGTGRETHDFIVSHLFTSEMNGYHAGDVEYPTVTKTKDGIRFKVFGLSPISIGWTDVGKLQNIVDNGTKKSSHKSSSSSSSTTETVSQPVLIASAPTSDNNKMMLYILLMFISIGGIGILYDKKRKDARRF